MVELPGESDWFEDEERSEEVFAHLHKVWHLGPGDKKQLCFSMRFRLLQLSHTTISLTFTFFEKYSNHCRI